MIIQTVLFLPSVLLYRCYTTAFGMDWTGLEWNGLLCRVQLFAISPTVGISWNDLLTIKNPSLTHLIFKKHFLGTCTCLRGRKMSHTRDKSGMFKTTLRLKRSVSASLNSALQSPRRIISALANWTTLYWPWLREPHEGHIRPKNRTVF